jgi:hypothetical protein
MSEERDQLPADDNPVDDDDIDLGAIDADGNEIEPDEPAGPDGAAEPDEPPAPLPDERRERQRTRAGQVGRLRAENADLARRIVLLEQQRATPPPAPPDPQAQAREEQEFRAALEQMLPHEAALAVSDRSERRMQAQLARVALQSFDRTDTADFRRLQSTNRAAARLAAQVEETLKHRREIGDFTLGRKDILAHLVGMELLDRPAAPARPNGRRPAQRPPASGRGDVVGAPAGGRRRSEAAADVALLRGITTADI